MILKKLKKIKKEEGKEKEKVITKMKRVIIIIHIINFQTII